MSIALSAVTLTVGQQQNVSLDYDTQFLLVTNKSLVDVQYTGFGIVGSDWIPAGQQIKLSRAVNSSGQIAFTAFNSGNLSPLPPNTILMTSFSSGEEPQGIWPITIPNPAVVALSTGSIINTGGASRTPIVSGQPANDAGTSNFPTNITNDGQAVFGDTNNPGSVSIEGNGFLGVISALNPGNPFQMTYSANQVVNGSTSGNVSLFAIMSGTYKLYVVIFSNYRNGSAPAQTIVLPSAFVDGFRYYAGNVSPTQFLHNSVAQQLGVITSFAGGGGNIAVVSTLNKYSIGDMFNPIDTLSFTGSQASAFTGYMELSGI